MRFSLVPQAHRASLIAHRSSLIAHLSSPHAAEYRPLRVSAEYIQPRHHDATTLQRTCAFLLALLETLPRALVPCLPCPLRPSMKASPAVQVPKNSRGGILVCESEIKAAFDFFDVEGKGVITASTLRKRLGAFHRSLSAREARVLMNNKADMTLDDLREVLLENELTNFDPVAEAFKAYDPESTGFMDAEILRNIFDNLGFGHLSDEDLAVLVEAADGDGDGRVGIDDFRGMCDSVGKREGAKDAEGKLEEGDQTQGN